MNRKMLAQVIGDIPNPWSVLNPNYEEESGKGLIQLLRNLFQLAVIAAGLFTLINLIIAGYEFISAQGDTEKVTNAWNKIWQSLVGLLIVGAAFVIAALFGYLVFGNPTAIISPTIYGPGAT